MQSRSYQTVRLKRGKHATPDDGACVMELASMLAGERFSDRPESVCPVIGSFLRAYNDTIDDERRQDLYAYAAKVVDSRASEEIERARAERLIYWNPRRRPRRWRRLRFVSQLLAMSSSSSDYVGIRAVHTIKRHDDRSHAEVLALVDELLALGAAVTAEPAANAGKAGAPRGVAPMLQR